MKNQPVVLYVEDDPQSRKLMQMLLMGRMQLKDLIVFEDSSDFLTRVNALDPKPDIIFLDIHVKPYSGFDMLQMLRQLDWVNGTPIVALTASVMSEEVEQLQNAGFNGCLAKPINLDTFPDTFMRILDGEWVWRIIH
jgi:two-component system, sensor histidine kinase